MGVAWLRPKLGVGRALGLGLGLVVLSELAGLGLGLVLGARLT